MNSRVYDCFPFFNEFELLDIRISELRAEVDYFVICESNLTFQGDPKPLYFLQRAQEYASVANKIIHIVVDDLSPKADETEQASIVWGREYAQRNALRRGLNNASDRDIIMISDCDEIISASTVKKLRGKSGYFVLDMPMYQFYFNMRALASGWRKAFAFSFDLLDRIPDFNENRRQEKYCLERFGSRGTVIERAGWHFTFIGGPGKVKEKLYAYSHTDGWQRDLWEDRALQEQMDILRQVGSTKLLSFQAVDESFPCYVIDNKADFENKGLLKTFETRFREIEKALETQSSRLANAIEALKDGQEIEKRNRDSLIENGIILPVANNRILNSGNFSKKWSGGVQTKPAIKSRKVKAPVKESEVMMHSRDVAIEDANVGYFRNLFCYPGEVLTGSCYIYLPDDADLLRVFLMISDSAPLTAIDANLNYRNEWQRISVTARLPQWAASCHLILYLSTNSNVEIFSSCWQLEPKRESR